MGISILCSCGSAYNLKDQLAGKLVECPRCHERIRVGAIKPQADLIFEREKFLLRQKLWAIAEKYHVWDENGNSILYIERPRHLMRNLTALVFGLIGGGVILFAFMPLAAAVPDEGLKVSLFIAGVLVAVAVFLAIAVGLSKKRHATFYADESKQRKLFEILQDRKLQFPVATYTVKDGQGLILAQLRKNYIYDLFRKQWDCYGPNGGTLCIAKEESVILSLLRRLLGSFFGLLRINFIILDNRGRKVIGEFNRKFTLLDRYVLDMSSDPRRLLDRRIALAIGVMIDSGERR